MAKNLSVVLDTGIYEEQAEDFKAWLKDNYGLDCELYLDSYCPQMELTGPQDKILEYVLDPGGYDEDMEWVEEFCPELLE